MAVSSLFGAKVKRVEDPKLITGQGIYVDDITLPGMLYMTVLRSPYAHAKINSIDLSSALKNPNVVMCVTGKELKNEVNYLQVGWDASSANPPSKVPKRYPLESDKVRYVGDGVAALVATDKYTAKDVLESISVDYTPLSVVTKPKQAIAKDAPILHEELGSNETWNIKMQFGDFTKSFNNSDVIIKEKLINQRLIPSAMETRGVVASYNLGTKQLTLWSSTQIPHQLKKYLSFTLRISENKIRVIAPEVGGGFGSKLNFYPEEALACYLSMKTGKPVKWIEERRENMTNTIHGRDYEIDVEAGFKKDGTIQGVKCKVFCNVGAYYMHFTALLPHLTALMIPGCYKLPSLDYDCHVVLTNIISTDAYRGAGRPESIYIIERIMDLAALELDMDPVDIRLKNFPQSDEFPFTTTVGLAYDSGDYSNALNEVLKLVDYSTFRNKQKELRKQNKYIGIGFSSYTEICGWGPSAGIEATYPKTNAVLGKWEYGAVRFDPSGKVTVETGSSPHGQGNETTWAQLVAHELGVSIDDIVVLHGDTDAVPYGVATYASRSATLGGVAVYNACQKIREKAKLIVAKQFEARHEDIVFDQGKFSVKGLSEKFMSITDVAKSAFVADNLPENVEPGLSETSFYDPSNFTFPFGAIAIIVEVDILTGEIKILDYSSIDDCGNVINPMIVDGQLHGGAAQGIAQAQFEEAKYDDNGQLITSSFMNYYIPTAFELPNYRLSRTITPSPVNPLGVKGVGEAATIGSPPAFVNAVIDALKPFGIKNLDMPLKPETVWNAINNSKK